MSEETAEEVQPTALELLKSLIETSSTSGVNGQRIADIKSAFAEYEKSLGE